MARRSSIDRLDPKIREQVDLAVKRGATIDEITLSLSRLGQDVSRSAVGRYTKRFSEFAARQRDICAVAEAFGAEFGEKDNDTGKLLMQLISSIGARMALGLATEDDPSETINLKEFELLARATKHVISAAKVDADRDARIRDEAAKLARTEAAKQAEAAQRELGASEDTIRLVKNRILGIAT